MLRRALIAVVALLVLPAAAKAQDRYSLANGCYSLRAANGQLVGKTSDGGYRAGAGAERFRMQATDLGSYLLYGAQRDFLAEGTKAVAPGLPLPVGTTKRIQAETAPSAAADWRVEPAGGAFTLWLGNRALATGDGGALVLGSRAEPFTFVPAQGCADYPEAETDVAGEPSRGPVAYGEVSGLLDAHMHMMAFEFLGGRIHCGRPWHRFGVASALVDCPDHEPGGVGAIGENTISYGNPVGTHDTRGWPTLKDWPHHASLTHEQTYYKWVERSWRAGLRLFVNLLVDNEVLCTAYPYKSHGCNEMDGVRLQAQRLRELQDYIDAQNGGPGKGWFRLVYTPYEARRVINEGKLAVVMGIEVSKLFDCGVQDDKPECTAEQIDQRLDDAYKLGVRDMELVNKFDNALGGVAGDSGTTGTAVNAGNRVETGRFWAMGPCADAHNHDKDQYALPGQPDRDALAGNLLNTLLGPGATPIYGPPPHCNSRGLSPLGAHLVERMMDKRMIIDPDHLSVLARQQLLDVVEKRAYSGIISSHSWSSPDAIPRIFRLGGVVTPMAGAAPDFVKVWKEIKPQRDPRFYYGLGWGADMNGFAHQGDPHGGPNPVRYPFKSFDGRQTVFQQRTGQRVYDINVDGMAHYGLFPDWVEDARLAGGEQIVRDLGRGAEAYLQMWERADGVPPTRCQPRRSKATRRGISRLRLGASADALLRRAGQPRKRKRAWTWCALGGGRMTAVLSKGGRVTTVVSTSKRTRGRHARKLRGGRRVVRGKRWVAVTTMKGRKAIRRDLRRAGVQ